MSLTERVSEIGEIELTIEPPEKTLEDHSDFSHLKKYKSNQKQILRQTMFGKFVEQKITKKIE